MTIDQAPNIKVVELGNTHVGNVASNMRKLADRIEAGEFGKVLSAAIVVDTAKEQKVFAWGGIVNQQMIIGILQAAVVRLCTAMFD